MTDMALVADILGEYRREQAREHAGWSRVGYAADTMAYWLGRHGHEGITAVHEALAWLASCGAAERDRAGLWHLTELGAGVAGHPPGLMQESLRSLGGDERLGREKVAALMGVRPDSVSSMASRGKMPPPDGRWGTLQPWWWRTTVERHMATRPGRGARTDLR